MKLRFACPLLLALVAANASAAPIVPGPVPGGLEPELDARLFLNHEDLSFLVEGSASNQTDDRQLRRATAGAYYRLLDNLSVGAFYRLAYGLRHDEDWVEPTSGQWLWADTNGRAENFVILDVTPRARLPFLPGEDWVAELKARYLYDTFDHEETLLLRPGLTYFWLRDDEPFLNFFLQLELDFPLNYGVQTIYEKWLYLGVNHPFAPWLSLGAYGALKWETWGSTPAFVAQGGTPYAITTETEVVGIFAVFQLGI